MSQAPGYSTTEKGLKSATYVHHVSVGPKPDVVGQIPADVIGIVVDDYLVVIPGPVGDKAQIEGRDAPVEVIEPEPAWSSASQVPDVTLSDTAVKSPMFERFIKVEIGIVAASIMTNPLAVGMNVGRFGMTWLIGRAVLPCFRLPARWLRSPGRCLGPGLRLRRG